MLPSHFLSRPIMMMAVCAGLLALSGCAKMPANGSNPDQVNTVDSDPIEPFNRSIFEFNRVVDGVVLKPVTQMYRGVMPETGQQMVSNALSNIYTPVTFFNSVLQGDPENSFTSLWRFLINSTFGVAGLFDAASEVGLKKRTTSFGDTLAMYGADAGMYVVLPIIGPSNTRDSVGRLVDALINPFNHMGDGESIALWTATAIDQRSQNMALIDEIYRTSLDPYSTFRSGYTQKRAADVKRTREARRKSQEKAGF